MMAPIGFEVEEFQTNELPHGSSARSKMYLDRGGAFALEGKIIAALMPVNA